MVIYGLVLSFLFGKQGRMAEGIWAPTSDDVTLGSLSLNIFIHKVRVFNP